MNCRFVTIRNFRGSGCGAGDNTVSVQLSMSTAVLGLDYITLHSYDITYISNIHAEKSS